MALCLVNMGFRRLQRRPADRSDGTLQEPTYRASCKAHCSIARRSHLGYVEMVAANRHRSWLRRGPAWCCDDHLLPDARPRVVINLADILRPSARRARGPGRIRPASGGRADHAAQRPSCAKTKTIWRPTARMRAGIRLPEVVPPGRQPHGHARRAWRWLYAIHNNKPWGIGRTPAAAVTVSGGSELFIWSGRHQGRWSTSHQNSIAGKRMFLEAHPAQRQSRRRWRAGSIGTRPRWSTRCSQ
jgi:hypothetical protein